MKLITLIATRTQQRLVCQFLCAVGDQALLDLPLIQSLLRSSAAGGLR
jgi:hypothetical protein